MSTAPVVSRSDSPNRMAAIAVYPGRPGSLHLTKLERPAVGPDEAVVRVRRVGVCGTDKEIIEAKFGTPPPGTGELVLGHELLGVVEAIGDRVTTVKPGDLVAATVRRPDGCPACQAGQVDMCSWMGYTERGIIGAHGYMVERFVERADYLIPVPTELEPVGVLVEPLTVVEKAVRQADLIQRRLAVWQPASAIVLGAGPIGILGTMLLRARGVAVTTLARRPAPNPAATVIAACGARYVSTRETSLAEVAVAVGHVDLMLEASGSAERAFEAMAALGANGVLVLLSLTGGEATAPVPIAAINRGLVLGNKVIVGSVNAAREDFASAVTSLGRFEALWPGLAASLITTRLRGFDDALRIGDAATAGIKTVLEFSAD